MKNAFKQPQKHPLSPSVNSYLFTFLEPVFALVCRSILWGASGWKLNGGKDWVLFISQCLQNRFLAQASQEINLHLKRRHC